MDLKRSSRCSESHGLTNFPPQKRLMQAVPCELGHLWLWNSLSSCRAHRGPQLHWQKLQQVWRGEQRKHKGYSSIPLFLRWDASVQILTSSLFSQDIGIHISRRSFGPLGGDTPHANQLLSEDGWTITAAANRRKSDQSKHLTKERIGETLASATTTQQTKTQGVKTKRQLFKSKIKTQEAVRRLTAHRRRQTRVVHKRGRVRSVVWYVPSSDFVAAAGAMDVCGRRAKQAHICSCSL